RMLAAPRDLMPVDHVIELGLASATRLAYMECARQAPHSGKALAGDHRDQSLPSFPPKSSEIHVNARQRRPRRLDHHIPVVEADDRHAIGHVHSSLPQRVRSTARNLIVATKQRVGCLAITVE